MNASCTSSRKRQRTSPTTYINSDQENTEHFVKPTTPKRHSYQSPTRSSLARSHPKVLHEVEQAKQRRESASARRQSLRDYVLSKDSGALFDAARQEEPTEDSQPAPRRRRSLSNNAPHGENTAQQAEKQQDEATADVEPPKAPDVNHIHPAQNAPNFVDDIVNMFRDIEPRASPPTTVPATNTQPAQDNASPEPDVPPPRIPTPRRRWKSPDVSPAIVPRLVQSASQVSNDLARRSSSVELPPTPVQLGKEPAPARPRGLFSSSPGGSGRRRVRRRDGPVESSPLKPKDVAPQPDNEAESAILDDIADQIEIASGIGEEPEDVESEMLAVLENGDDFLPAVSDPPELRELPSDELVDRQNLEPSDPAACEDSALPPVQILLVSEDSLFGDEGDAPQETTSAITNAIPVLDEESDDPVVQEKQVQLRALQKQLKQLRSDLDDLERFAARDADAAATAVDSADACDIELLLDTLPKHTDSWPVREEDVPLFKQHSSKYLSIFALQNLKLTIDRWTNGTSDAQELVYQTTLSAAAPFPPHTFDVTLETTLDLEDDTIKDIVFLRNRHVPTVLSDWIGERLQHPVMTHDLATIIKGIGRYLTADIRRARIYRHLEKKLRGEKDVSVPDLESPVTSQSEALSLLPYLSRSSYSFAPDGVQQKRTRNSAGSKRQLMLTCDIELDWIGRANTRTDICLYGFTDRVAKQAKRLFRQIDVVDGPIRAFEAVRKMTAKAGVFDDVTKLKKSKAKARRMTVFD